MHLFLMLLFYNKIEGENRDIRLTFVNKSRIFFVYLLDRLHKLSENHHVYFCIQLDVANQNVALCN
jgi:hypothetical protein